MDIDELKNEFGALSAPEELNIIGMVKKDQSSAFINRLKKSDKKSKQVLKRFYIIYFVIAAFYFGLFILNPDPDLKLNDRINGTLLFMGIMLFALLGRMKYSDMRKIHYDKPSIEFLNDAHLRYKFWSKEMNYVVLIVVMINVGSCRSYVINYPQFENVFLDILAFEVVFLMAMSIGIYFGYQHWKANKKPISDEINNLIREMQ